jgi:hypothetical protein
MPHNDIDGRLRFVAPCRPCVLPAVDVSLRDCCNLFIYVSLCKSILLAGILILVSPPVAIIPLAIEVSLAEIVSASPVPGERELALGGLSVFVMFSAPSSGHWAGLPSTCTLYPDGNAADIIISELSTEPQSSRSTTISSERWVDR